MWANLQIGEYNQVSAGSGAAGVRYKRKGAAMSVKMALDLTEKELTELRQRTNAIDAAAAVSRAAREFLRACRLRELTAVSGKFDFDDHAWRELEAAELRQPAWTIDLEESRDD